MFNNVVYLLLFVRAYFVVLVSFVLLMWVYTARDFGGYCWRYCLRICLFVSRRAGFGICWVAGFEFVLLVACYCLCCVWVGCFGLFCLIGACMVVLGLVGLRFCCLCLAVSVNSVGCWLVMYCMYGFVASFSFFDLIASCWFVVVCICLG